MTSPSAPDPPSSSDPVDRGLAAGFGPQAPEGAAGQSVLGALQQRGGVVARVLLRDATESGTPVLRPLPPAERERAPAAGRYQFQGEIARGGVGVILKGHDQDLGRDVAIKVLHERYKDDASLLRRFVEEAQIGGQLQHPGIVPVYELGLHEGRPFFTMKLIKGRTLAALLAERADPGQDRRRWLGIFEQVCQTVAYAHARGVIHRDLKPANVMVGTFGEVQVVDWGMAKVLAQGGVADERKQRHTTVATVRSREGSPPGTSSVAGSVMGTPSYMPPEQATGDVEHLDERSDVFALGAILCEVLTGQPPYAGTREEVLAMAAQAELAAARQRLEQRAVEAELAALVTECMAMAPAARPRDAHAVAARIGAYLASSEQRAQDARVEAAEARVNARAERRARVLGLSLATAVLALAVLGGGGWLWLDGLSARRRHATEQAVTTSLGDAALARGRQDWVAARAALERAQVRLEAGESTAELRAQLAATRAEIEREATVAEQKAALAADNVALLAALQDVHHPIGEPFGPADWARLDAEYGAIFAVRGIDVDANDRSALAGRLGERALGGELAAVFDEWAAVRTNKADAAGAARLSTLAGLLDPDPVRQELRTALAAKDTARLRQLAAGDGVATLPAPTLRLLGPALGQSHSREQAVVLLETGRLRFPRDFSLAMVTGRQQLLLQRGHAAARHYTAALALRPESPEAWRGLGYTYEKNARLDQALELFTIACGKWPEDAHLRFHLAIVLQAQGKAKQALAAYRKTVELDPAHAGAHTNLGKILYERRDLDEALQYLRKAVELDRDGAGPNYNLGVALHDKGDLDGALKYLHRAVELSPRSAGYHNGLGNVLNTRKELDAAIASYRTAIGLEPKSLQAHNNLGNALREKGEIDHAIASFHKAIELDPRNALIHSNLGLAFEGKGDFDQAALHHRKAIDLDRGYASAHYNLGIALYRKQDFDGALVAFRDAVALSPDNPRYRNNLGLALWATGDHDGAGESFRRAVQLGMKTPGVLDAAAWWLVTRTGRDPADVAEAVRYAREASAERPTDATSQRTLGVALYRAGDFTTSAAALERAREGIAPPGRFTVALFLAMAWHKLGRTDEARQLHDQVAASLATPGQEGDEAARFLAEAEQALGIEPRRKEP